MKTVFWLVVPVLIVVFGITAWAGLGSSAATNATVHPVTIYGVAFKFDSITVSPEQVIPRNTNQIVDSKTMTQLAVNGTFTGNYDTLLNSGHYGSYSLFYVTDGAGNVYNWNIISPKKATGTIEVIFDIPSGAPHPYVMHTDVDKTWLFDLVLK
ncbi:MAG TPA: hypothetical protein VMR19_00550 [Candidatus Saccharimonadales bacterium]|jgi:hypothetical protein|nr:hypothetical protein [Candidatus Saccharimonadales bacterium]